MKAKNKLKIKTLNHTPRPSPERATAPPLLGVRKAIARRATRARSIIHPLTIVMWLCAPSWLACANQNQKPLTQRVSTDPQGIAPGQDANNIPDTLIAISVGHTGCHPDLIRDFKIIDTNPSRSMTQRASWRIWNFKCNQTRYICSLVRELYTNGEQLSDTSCAEQIEEAPLDVSPSI